MSRNIKIVSGADAGWGYSTIVYSYNDTGIIRVGSVELDGVQFDNGGQL